jgi:hypothetical protein
VVEAAGAKRARAAYRKTFIDEFVLALSDSRGSMEFIGVELAFHHTERPAIDKSTYPTRVGHPRPRRPVPRSTAAVSIQMN